MGSIPQIDIGKRPEEFLNKSLIPPLPSQTPYGNLLLKMSQIIGRLDRVNVEISRVFETYVHPSQSFSPSTDICEHQRYAEQAIYWLRKSADELIALAFVLERRNATGE